MATRILQRGFGSGEVSPAMFGRIGNVDYEHGASLLQNLIASPQGPAVKRPGTTFVGEAKDSTNRVRLMDFKFSSDQQICLQWGRATVDSREIGNIRFHSQGATVLYEKPALYVDTQPVAIGGIDPVTDQISVTSHPFQTGDPVVVTMGATAVEVTFNPLATQETVDFVTFDPAGINDGDQVMFVPDGISGAVPPELEPYRIYYALNIVPGVAGTLQVSDRRGGPRIAFTNSGLVDVWLAAMPALATGHLDVGQTVYVINVDSDSIQLALSHADALLGNAIDFTGEGTNDTASDLRIHYKYEPGDLVDWTGTGPGDFYCMRRPWGEEFPDTIPEADHLDHPPTNTSYWYREPGVSSTVTFSTIGDLVNWAAHGWPSGTPVLFSTTGTLPTPLVVGNVYYVRDPQAGTFVLSETPSGPILDLTGSPTGTHTALANPIYEVPHYYTEDQMFELSHAQSGDVLSLAHQHRPFAELKRFGATRWVLEDLVFNAAIRRPQNVQVTGFAGDGLRVTVMTATNPSQLQVEGTHLFEVGDPVQVFDLDNELPPNTGIPDGIYKVKNVGSNPPGGPPFNTVNLGHLGNNNDVASNSTVVVNSSRIHFASVAEGWDGQHRYVVTALNANGEESRASAVVSSPINLFVTGSFNTITWDAVPGAQRYRIYKRQTGLFGYIGEVDADLTLEFKDDNIGPDLGITPPLLDNSLVFGAEVTFDLPQDLVLWEDHGLPEGAPITFHSNDTLPTGIEVRATYFVVNPSPDAFQISATPGGVFIDLDGSPAGVHGARAGFFPGAVGYFEQRRTFAGAFLVPQDVWMTASGTESDLTFTIPVQDSDRIRFRIAARERSVIRHFAPLTHLLLLTDSGEYRVTPINDDAITPLSISVRGEAFVGSSRVAPVIVNSTVLFAAARGGHIRELGYRENVRGFLPADISLRAGHLFDNQDIVQMAYSRAPQPVVWAVSSNGKLYGLTYIPEEAVGAWHQHTTDGSFESCAVISEGDEDHLYVVVQRNINGQDVRYIERMALQTVDESAIEDLIRLDSALVYDGPATNVVSGLDHFEGEVVWALADGLVRGPFTVSSGQITLSVAAFKVVVGQLYTAKLQTLPIAMQLDAFGKGRPLNFNKVSLRVYQSGGFEVGPSETRLRPSKRPTAGALLSDEEEVTVPSDWQRAGGGTVLVQQATPLPLSVTSITFEVEAGGG